jgi:hypothetical protein
MARENLRDKRVLVRCYHGLGGTIQFIGWRASMKLSPCTMEA